MTTEEKIDVLDAQGIRTGEILPKHKIHTLGKIHRAVQLYLFDPSNQLLLQRRALHTDHYPGKFSISVTGHVQAGESSSDAMKRELQEELGLDPADVVLDFLFSFRQDVILSTTYIDYQFNEVYVGKAGFPIQHLAFNVDVVSELQLVTWPAFQAMVLAEEEELAPGYARACQDVAYFLQHKRSPTKPF